MEPVESPYSDDEERAKLIPEWGVSADNQVVLGGLAAVVALFGLFAWNAWRGGDEDLATISSSILADPGAAIEESASPSGGDGGIVETATASDDARSTTPAVDDGAASSTTATTEATITTAAGPAVGDLQAAVTGLAGVITGSIDGTDAVLEGFAANQAESTEAETAAAAVEGVEGVDNRWVILEPQVSAALTGAGVVDADAAGAGTEVTVTGTIQSEDARQPALDAAAAVEGVTGVTDQLRVSFAADLNQLPQVQFATTSADILPASFADLDAAAELITAAGDVQLQLDGWTDVQGGEAANLTLSQARADAVVAYLVDAGVPDEQLTAVGNGETDQFAAGETPEALQANRVVLFTQTG